MAGGLKCFKKWISFKNEIRFLKKTIIILKVKAIRIKEKVKVKAIRIKEKVKANAIRIKEEKEFLKNDL